jgi:hypothetical protein
VQSEGCQWKIPITPLETTCKLPACSAVPQLVPPCAPVSTFTALKFLYEYSKDFSKQMFFNLKLSLGIVLKTMSMYKKF